MQTPVTFTREQLYERVWQTPMIKLAAEFGLSDNGLRKICKKLDIPCPPAGWWAKKAAGKKVQDFPLPAQRQGVPDRAQITPSPSVSDDLKQAIRSMKEHLGPIGVPERLTRPHPVIAEWISDRQRRGEEAAKERNPYIRAQLGEHKLTASDRRRHRLLHVLFRTLERKGARFHTNERNQPVAEIDGASIPIEMREKLRQIHRPLTEEERRWETWNVKGTKTELEPTGLFECTIDAWTEQPVRKRWQESDVRPMEGFLSEIAATLLILGPIIAERNRKREEEARVFAERQRQLEKARQERQQDEKRWRRFTQIAGAWRSNEIARAFVAKLRNEAPPPDVQIDGLSIAEWLAWAEASADRFDPIAQGLGAIFEDVATVKSWTRLD